MPEAAVLTSADHFCKGLQVLGPVSTDHGMCLGRLKGKTVVVKWAYAALATEEMESLENEASALDSESCLSRLQGVCVPHLIYDGWSDDDHTYVVVTEFVDGSHPDEDSSDEMLRCALEALKSVHDAGFAHGNLQATNIILQKHKVFLTDFRGCISYPSAAQLKRDMEQLLQAFERAYVA